MRIPFVRHISWYLIIAMFIIGIAPKGEAGLAPSGVIAMSQMDRATDIEKIQKVIEMKMVGDRLEKFGLTKGDISKRLDNLSDQQVHKLALQVDDLKIGKGDALGVIIALLVIALLVVLLLQLTGHRVIVTK
ncbi:MAG: PA2779 family protein [Nitrospirae bacterium]|nr:PA2779 family protein [Nitrospirota bacterium]